MSFHREAKHLAMNCAWWKLTEPPLLYSCVRLERAPASSLDGGSMRELPAPHARIRLLGSIVRVTIASNRFYITRIGLSSSCPFAAVTFAT